MDYEFNYELLKRYIKDSVFSTKDICSIIGISETTFYWQVRNDRLLLSTLFAIADVLCLEDEELLKLLKKGE